MTPAPIHTYPRGGTMQDYPDLAHDLGHRQGERITWTSAMPVDGCVCCDAGVCTQKVVAGPSYEREHVIHGVLVL